MRMQSEPPQESDALDFDWNTDDEREVFGIEETVYPSFPATFHCKGEASSSAGSSSSSPFNELLAMGFKEDMISRAIKEHGNDSDLPALIETLVQYSESSKKLQGCEIPPEESHAPYRAADQQTFDDHYLSSSDYDESFIHHLSDSDSGSDENSNCSSVKDEQMRSLVKMGYPADEVSIALDRCGPGVSILVLLDFISAHRLSKEQDCFLPEARPSCSGAKSKKRKLLSKKKEGNLVLEDDCLRLPKPMVGFGLPSGPRTTHRELPKEAIGPPYFYYENVALTPKGVWQTISQNLYGIQPEFVDSKHFCVAARKRGYVHNLPLDNRSPLYPIPHMTISDAFPLSRKWWPRWDERTKLNCLLTVYSAAKEPERIRTALKDWEGEPPINVKKYVMGQCRKWNLVWVGKHKVAPLDPGEVEKILGFPENHTRGGGISILDRYKLLGNSFQVDTVAYHLSPLTQVRRLHPEGLNVLSLFSGIGGAEVALHRLGIQFKTVVSAEKCEASREVLRSWWEENDVKGKLIEFKDVQELNSKKLEELIERYGGFDLVIGGSPCTNLAGGNRHSRHGLEGKDSVLFFEYVRILKHVKELMSRIQY